MAKILKKALDGKALYDENGDAKYAAALEAPQGSEDWQELNSTSGDSEKMFLNIEKVRGLKF